MGEGYKPSELLTRKVRNGIPEFPLSRMGHKFMPILHQAWPGDHLYQDYLLFLVPSSGFQLLATLCTAEQNSARSFCPILSSFRAVSDNALLLFIGFSWPVVSEVVVLLPSLSQSESSAETSPPWVTLLVFEIVVTQLSASQQHAATTWWQLTDGWCGSLTGKGTQATVVRALNQPLDHQFIKYCVKISWNNKQKCNCEDIYYNE